MEKSVGSLLRNLEGPILLTGHTGFKGTWLLRYLDFLKIDVIGYSLPPEPDSLYLRANLMGKHVEEFGDVRDYTKFEEFAQRNRPAVILHLAAQALVSDSYTDPIGTFETNVIGTANVLAISKNLPSAKAIGVVTTDKVYRNENRGVRFKETDPILGSDPYSASKAATENVIEAWRHMTSDFGVTPILSLRAGNVIGGGDLSKNRLIPDLIRGFTQGREVNIRNSESTRPWQHVLDPLNGYLSAIEYSLENESSETFNFGPTEKSLKVKDVVEIFQSEWQNLKVSYSTTPVNYESNFLDLDSSHAQETLKWFPKLDQINAIKKTISWWNQHLVNRKTASACIDEQLEYYIST